MEDRTERSYLARTTCNLETLNWFIPDTESIVRVAIVQNPLFNREIYEKLNCNECVIKKELLKLDFLTVSEKIQLQKEIGAKYEIK